MRDDEEDEEEEEDVQALLNVAPDGGYGWVIVFISFVGLLLFDGVSYSLFLFREPIARALNLSTKETSATAAIFYGLNFFAGPLSSGLANRYGFRRVLISGIILSMTAFYSGYFGMNIIYYYCLVGGLGGIGGSLIYIPLLLPVTFWFDKRRAIAISISASGSGIGTLITPILSQMIMDKFTWRDAFWFHGSVVGLILLLAIFLKPLPTVSVAVEEAGRKAWKETMSQKFKKEERKHRQYVTAKTAVGSGNFAIAEVDDMTKASMMRVLDSSQPNPQTPPVRTLPRPSRTDTLHLERSSSSFRCSTCCRRRREEVHNRPLYRDDAFYAGSVYRLKSVINVETPLTYTMSVTRVASRRDIEEEKEGKCVCCPEGVKRIVWTMLDFRMLGNFSMLCMALSQILYYFACFLPYTFISGHPGVGNSKLAEFLVPAIGIGTFLGRLLSGFLLQAFPFLSAFTFSVTITGLLAFLTGLLYILEYIEYIFFFAVIYGFLIGLYVPLRSLVLVDFFGLDRLTTATGVIFFFCGIGSTIGTPCAEHFIAAFNDLSVVWLLCCGFFLATSLCQLLMLVKGHMV